MGLCIVCFDRCSRHIVECCWRKAVPVMWLVTVLNTNAVSDSDSTITRAISFGKGFKRRRSPDTTLSCFGCSRAGCLLGCIIRWFAVGAAFTQTLFLHTFRRRVLNLAFFAYFSVLFDFPDCTTVFGVIEAF